MKTVKRMEYEKVQNYLILKDCPKLLKKNLAKQNLEELKSGVFEFTLESNCNKIY